MQETTAQYLERLKERLSCEYCAFWELHTMMAHWKDSFQYYIDKAHFHSRPITWLRNNQVQPQEMPTTVQYISKLMGGGSPSKEVK